MVMTNEERERANGRLVADYLSARQELATIQAEAASEAKVLTILVEYLRSGGRSVAPALGMPPSHYLNERVTGIMEKLTAAVVNYNELRERITAVGLRLAD